MAIPICFYTFEEQGLLKIFKKRSVKNLEFHTQQNFHSNVEAKEKYSQAKT